MISVEQFAEIRTGETEDYELVEGELIPVSSGTPLHAKVRDRAGDVVRSYLRRNPIGEGIADVDCRLSHQTVDRPDLSNFLGERSVPFAPDIAVEVLSPSETAMEVNRKALDYLAGGSKEVWLLDRIFACFGEKTS